MEQKQGTVTAEVASKSNACGASQQSIVQETASHDSPFQLLQHMQVAAGNRATGRWLQAKLRVGAPDDIYERQADRVADQIMCMPQPGPRQEAEQQLPGPALQRECATCEDEEELQRKCAECEDEEKLQRKGSECTQEDKMLQRREAGPGGAASSIVHDVLHSSGHVLGTATRAFMEPRFGQNFSQVRIHTGDSAARSARTVNALAYTVGSDVVFGSNRYTPETTEGRRLLAHELTHVVQQSSPSQTFGTRIGLQRQSGPGEEDEPPTEAAAPGLSDILSDVASRAASPVSAVGTSLASLFPSLPPPCHPATSLLMATTLHAFVSGSFIPFARGMFGPQTASLWAEYLNPSLGLPRPARSFAGSGEIVSGFTAHHKSAEAEQEIIDASVIALGGPAASSMPAPVSTTTVPVTSLVGAATLTIRINTGTDPMGLDYDSPATTIPGNIAGGIGSGGPPGNTVSDPDTRGVDGAMQLDLDASGTNLTVTPLLTFQVHDTVDFCPGALGGRLARVETVPMSILEATEGRFGPIFAADVPYDISYPGPGVSKTVAAPPPPPGPVPPVPTPPTPRPTPTPPTPRPTPSPTPVPPPQGVTPSPPSDLPCQVSTDIGIMGDKVKFRIGNANISTSAQIAAIRGFVNRWRQAGSSDDVRVDGYASVDGPNDLNWRLSCRRALSTAGALASDIPSGKINTRAHGPTDEFSPSDPTEDRVAVISSTVSPVPPGPTPSGPTPPGPVPLGPPPTPPGPVVSEGVTLKAMTFLSDHHVMKDNRSDWETGRKLFPKPEWEPANPGSQSAPISQDRNSQVVVELTYDASTGMPAGVPFTLTGQGSAGFLTFKGTGILHDGQNQVIVLNSVASTPNAITQSLGQAISWSIQLPSGRQPLATVQGLDVFVTMAPPRRPDEVTYKRMAKAVELAGSVHTLDPQGLVHGIMVNFGDYNLHVQYDNAWNLADNIKLGAQCIDIVRFVMGLIETVGCPGVAEAKLIWAKPEDPATAIESPSSGPSLDDYPPHPLHPTWGAGLIDINACPNNFEAALKFTFGGTRYYPGGVSLVGAGGRKIIFSSAQQVLEIFQYLAWIEGAGTVVVRVGTKNKTRDKWIAQEFLISYSHRRTDKVPFTLVCDSKVLP